MAELSKLAMLDTWTPEEAVEALMPSWSFQASRADDQSRLQYLRDREAAEFLREAIIRASRSNNIRIISGMGGIFLSPKSVLLWAQGKALTIAQELLPLLVEKPKIDSSLDKLLDKNHPHHSQELALAIRLWLEMFSEVDQSSAATSAKDLALGWIDQQAPNISNKAKARIATVVSWEAAKRGGQSEKIRLIRFLRT